MPLGKRDGCTNLMETTIYSNLCDVYDQKDPQGDRTHFDFRMLASDQCMTHNKKVQEHDALTLLTGA